MYTFRDNPGNVLYVNIRVHVLVYTCITYVMFRDKPESIKELAGNEILSMACGQSDSQSVSQQPLLSMRAVKSPWACGQPAHIRMCADVVAAGQLLMPHQDYSANRPFVCGYFRVM